MKEKFLRAMPIILDQVKKAQFSIEAETGLKVVLVPKPYYGAIEDNLMNLFAIVCDRFKVTIQEMQLGSRSGIYPDVRKLYWMLARLKYPKAHFKLMAEVAGVKDHSTVMTGINTGYDRLSIQDPEFIRLYNYVKDLFDVEAKVQS